MTSAKIEKIFDTMEYGPAPESARHALEWIENHNSGKFEHFINGKFAAPKSSKWFETRNPATGEKLARIAQGSAADVDAAVKAARKAQKEWQVIGGYERAKYLYALARLIQKNARLLAVLETLDNGKPIRETRDGDVPASARHFYHHAGWAQLLEKEFPGYEPYGVVGQIIPWNFPLLMLAWKIAPALAAGNTCVLKPAEFTSLTALLFAELCIEAGLPPGVVNIVTGDGKTGAAVVDHDGIDKIAFTGSTEVGRLIREATAGSGKALTLELGGKSPNIVFEDADLDSAVEGVVDSIWYNQGQVCCAGSRLLVQEGIAPDMIRKLTRRMENLRVGDPLDKSIDMGAVVDKVQYDRIDKLVKTGVKEGATLIQPGKDSCPTKGCFYPPTLLTNVNPASTVAEVEIFGPVLSVITFRTHEEAVALANNTRYGLAASIWSENINLALDVAPKIKAGVVWINGANMFDASCGFGGYRESGFGREGGREGMYAYLKPAYESKLPAYEATTGKTKKASAADRGHGKGLKLESIDRTTKLYIGGKQVRPDGEYSLPVLNAEGKILGQVGEGNRKDIRNAVEAARKAEGWAGTAQHSRAQILYYLAENLDARRDEFATRVAVMTGASKAQAEKEVEASLQRLFTYGAWCDKHDGAIHLPPRRMIAAAMNEPVGVVGIVCPDENPLLGFISLVAPAVAMGNRVVVVPSEKYPLSATDLYQVLETSDVPAGVINIVTGLRAELVKTMAEHDDIDALWCFSPDRKDSATIEKLSTGNLKQTWVNNGKKRDWFRAEQAESGEFLRRATQVKNVWIPYGENVA